MRQSSRSMVGIGVFTLTLALSLKGEGVSWLCLEAVALREFRK